MFVEKSSFLWAAEDFLKSYSFNISVNLQTHLRVLNSFSFFIYDNSILKEAQAIGRATVWIIWII